MRYLGRARRHDEQPEPPASARRVRAVVRLFGGVPPGTRALERFALLQVEPAESYFSTVRTARAPTSPPGVTFTIDTRPSATAR